jgi:WbqC-like protein family
MKVAILQSNYIPWKGYFDLIRRVDHFVFYDEVQFTKNDWRNRNKIKTAQGVQWLSIPAGQDIRRKISEVELRDASWQLKHLKTLRQNYRTAPYFKLYEPLLEDIYINNTWGNLSDLNKSSIQWIARDVLGLGAAFSDSLQHQGAGDRNLRLVNILKSTKASIYVTGPAALAYLDIQLLEQNGIQIEVMQYDGYPEYTQLHPPFSHHVSVLDLLFMTGPSAIHYLTKTVSK